VTMAGGYRLDALVAEEGWDKAKQNPDVRRLLQTTGSAVREVVGDDSWCRVAYEKAEYALEDTCVVCTDVRFRSEIETINALREDSHEYRSAIVRITRPGVGPVNGHISETAIDDIEPDFTIVNDGTEEELQAKLVAIATSLEKAAA
jgi:hypothetical protein